MLANLLSELRSYIEFKDNSDYQLEQHRWHHHPSTLHPRVLHLSTFTPTRAKPGGASEGFVGTTTQQPGEHFVKSGEDATEAAHELSAYSVLSSLGFRVPRVHLLRDKKRTNRVIATEAVQGAVPYLNWFKGQPGYPSSRNLMVEYGQMPVDPRDKLDQRLAGVLVGDMDRSNSGNFLMTPEGRRWDIDFAISDAAHWTDGMDDFEQGQIVKNLREHLGGQVNNPVALSQFTETMTHLSHPDREKDFDWLKLPLAQRSFAELGIDEPHTAILDTLSSLRPNFKEFADISKEITHA